MTSSSDADSSFDSGDADTAARRIGLLGFVGRLMVVATVVIVLAALWTLSSLVLLVYASVLFAILLHAVSEPLGRATRLPPLWSLALSVGIFMFLLAMMAALFGATVAQQFSGLVQRLPEALETIESRLRPYGLAPDLLSWVRSRISDGSGIASLTYVATGASNAFISAVVAFFGGVYLAAQPQLYLRGFVALFPPKVRGKLAPYLSDTARALRHWLVGQLATMVIVGVLTGIGAYLIGLPSSAALGVIAGLLEFVPYVGPIATALPAVLLALTVGADAVLWTLLLLFGVQQLEGYLLTPLIQRRAVSLPPALTLFALFAMGIIFGIPGVLLATPLTIALYVGVRDIYLPVIERTRNAGSCTA